MTSWEVSASGVSNYKVVMQATVSGKTVTVTAKWRRTAYGYTSFSDNATWRIVIDGTVYSGTWNFSGPAGGAISLKNIASRSKTVNYKGAVNVQVTVDFDVSPGSGHISKSVDVSTKPGKPGAPSLKFTAPRKVQASWSKPGNGGATIDSQQVQFSSSSNMSSPTTHTVSTNVTSYTETNAPLGKTRYVRVRAHNKNGWGSWSNVAHVAVPYAAPSKPTGLKATPVSHDQINIDWNLSSGRVTNYRIAYRKRGTSTWSYTTDTAPLRYLSGLATATKYEFRIQARNEDSSSGFTSSVYATTKAVAPSAPRSLSLSSPNSGQFKVTFTSPSNTGGKPITRYDMQYRKGTSGSWTVISDISSGYTRTGQTAGALYQVRVRARNADEIGPWTSASSVTTKANAPSKTPTPTLVIQANGKVKVTWNAPSSNGGKSINNYDIAYRVGTNSLVNVNNHGTSRSYVIPQIPDPGDRITVQVRAKNPDKTGAWSNQAVIYAKNSGSKPWNGSKWDDGVTKIWNGSSMVDAIYKVWDGSKWADPK